MVIQGCCWIFILKPGIVETRCLRTFAPRVLLEDSRRPIHTSQLQHRWFFHSDHGKDDGPWKFLFYPKAKTCHTRRNDLRKLSRSFGVGFIYYLSITTANREDSMPGVGELFDTWATRGSKMWQKGWTKSRSAEGFSWKKWDRTWMKTYFKFWLKIYIKTEHFEDFFIF